MKPLLDVTDLHVRFDLKEGTVRAVNGVSLAIQANKTLGVVGESGCGKSITAKAILQILPPRGVVERGAIHLAPRNGEGTPTNLLNLAPGSKAMRRIRGADVSMIFQEPMVSLSPVHTVGNQISENVRLHQGADRKEARERSIDILHKVGVPNPEQRVDAYPHELSGGLRQRCVIAMALVCNPRLLIADEPTTALDVTIQGQILRLIEELKAELGMAVMMITHDLGVIAEIADEVAVMYLGRVVEQAPVGEIFANPKHPYTEGLLESIPKLGRGNATRLATIPGTVPDPFTTPPGCPFHARCSKAIAGTCDQGTPPTLRSVTENHTVACALYDEGSAAP